MIAAIVPAKALDQAKQRLAALLSEDERRALALAMLEDVVSALTSVPRITSVHVVSPDADVLALAEALGATPLPEPPSVRGINQALDHAREAIGADNDGLVVVLADVAAITPADVEEALGALPVAPGVVICPSHDKGTSLLFARPPSGITFRFGRDSFQNHKREAAARGVPAPVLRLDALARDIDEPDDLLDLLANPGDTATHRVLATLDIASRLEVVP